MSTLAQRLQVFRKAAAGIFNENSLRQAYGLLAGALPGGVGTPPLRGTPEYLRAYSEMPWLRAVSSRIATATAQADWQIFVSRKKGGKAKRDGRVVRIQRSHDRKERLRLLKQAKHEDDLDEITDHPMLEVLQNANSFQTGFAMRKITQLHLDLVGDAFWLKERDRQGTVIAVWPVPPHWILATPTPAFQFYRVSFRAWHGLIPDSEFIWFSDDDPLFPYGRGTGIARALADELETDEYAAKHTKAFFYNQARPDFIIWPKGSNIRQAEAKRFEEEWLNRNQGFWRAFKPYFLSREVEVKQLDQNFRSLQFVQLREYERSTIMQVFGIPPEILGVLEHSNRSTIDAADYLMSRYCTEPRLEFQRSVLQERLVPEYDDRLIIEYVSPVQEDKAAEATAATAAPWALSVDEWRGLQGQKPMDDPDNPDAGKLHFVPTLGSFEILKVPEEEPPPVPGLVPPHLLPPGAPGSAADRANEELQRPPERPALPDANEQRPAGPSGDPNVPEGQTPAQPPKPARLPPGTQEVAYRRAISLGYLGAEDGAERHYRAAAAAGDAGLEAALRKATSLDLEKLPAAVAQAARMEPSVARTLVRTWKAHAKRVNMRQLRQALGPEGTHGDVMAALDIPGLQAAQSKALRPQLQRGFLRGIDEGAKVLRHLNVPVRLAGEPEVEKAGAQIVVNLTGVNQAAQDWADEHAAELLDAPAEIQQQIRDLVVETIATGAGLDRLANLLRDSIGLNDRQAEAVANFQTRLLDREDPNIDERVAAYADAQLELRAMTIARTEMMSALNGGQQATWSAAVSQGVIRGDQFEQVWIVTDDERLCDDCEPMADLTAPIDGEFEGDGGDGPPLHANCRCTVGLQPAEGA